MENYWKKSSQLSIFIKILKKGTLLATQSVAKTKSCWRYQKKVKIITIKLKFR